MMETTPLQGGRTSANGSTPGQLISFEDAHKDSPRARMEEHLGEHRQYARDMILGVNDGIISTFLLVTGVAGGGLDSRNILLTSIAGSIAGAVSMCAGEYVATKSQNEVIHSELALEKIHVERYLDEELSELGNLIGVIGIPEAEETLREHLRQFYSKNPDSLLQLMKVLEFGVLDSEMRSPIQAGLFSCLLFAVGSMPSVIPFIFSGDQPYLGLIGATVLTIVALMVVGAVKTWATRTSWISAALENLAIAGCGGVLAYSVGNLFGAVVGK